MNATSQTHTAVASPLLEKARRLGLQLPVDLERLALERGCTYYERDLGPRVPPLREILLSNAELAVALLTPSLPPTAREIRLAAALLGAAGMHSDEIARLAAQEQCTGVVRFIAGCGRRYEPQNQFWHELLELLPAAEVDSSRWPHPTRFIEMTGIDRGKVGFFTRWIRPQRREA